MLCLRRVPVLVETVSNPCHTVPGRWGEAVPAPVTVVHVQVDGVGFRFGGWRPRELEVLEAAMGALEALGGCVRLGRLESEYNCPRTVRELYSCPYRVAEGLVEALRALAARGSGGRLAATA